MLKLNPDPSFKADVEITIPGQSVTGTVNLTMKYMNRKDYAAWLESLRELKDPDKGGKEGKVTRPGKTALQAFQEFVLGWDLADEFTVENIGIFLDNYPAAYPETLGKYTRLLFESRVKN